MNRDPEKARAWQERSARKAHENRRARAIASGKSSTLPRAANPVAKQEPGQVTGSPKRKSGLSSRSRKPSRVAHFAAVAEACRTALERDGGCLAAPLVPEVRCWGKLDPQHVIPQGVRRDLAADPENIVGCCRGHHEWIGDHPEAARALGLHGHDGDDLGELKRRRLTGGANPA